jgi:hypothetical protein
MHLRPLLLVAVIAGIVFPSGGVRAQTDQADAREGCPAFIAALAPRIMPASLKLAALAGNEARITYAGHSTFLIESPRSVRIATDYNDYIQLPGIPTIATMNHAHDTHFSVFPDPAIAHVLRGWAADESPARHDLRVQDVRVRNVPTNIRSWSGGTERHGNSIFVFEVAGLCIAHLGHLHHTLTQQQLEEIGRIDVVLVPVDGSFTLDLADMIDVLRALKAPLMIPMHYFSAYTLQRFLDRAQSESWAIERSATPTLVLSRRTLPTSPKVLVLPGH